MYKVCLRRARHVVGTATFGEWFLTDVRMLRFVECSST